MAKCPFAIWDQLTGDCGAHLGGPFKIVHHTTEGSGYAGARATFLARRTDPHFTVDDTTIYQHIDTERSARSLRNAPGGRQTNRDSAIQIELVGFAGRPKSVASLRNVARLCRWLEATHQIPKVWPNGLPMPARNGRDPGGHNRDAETWDTVGGHYGHSHVPENTHWDPAYTADELAIVMDGQVAVSHAATPTIELSACPEGIRGDDPPRGRGNDDAGRPRKVAMARRAGEKAGTARRPARGVRPTTSTRVRGRR